MYTPPVSYFNASDFVGEMEETDYCPKIGSTDERAYHSNPWTQVYALESRP